MIGNGYGSEFHLLRWMGRHRGLFNQRVSTAVGRPGSVIKWMDFGFDGPVGPRTSGLELGTSSGPLPDRIHELFLPVSESSLQEFCPKTAMTNLRAIQ